MHVYIYIYIYICINTELLDGNKGHQEETHHPTHRFRRLFLDLLLMGWRGCASAMGAIKLPPSYSSPQIMCQSIHFSAPNSIWYFLQHGLWCPSFPVGLSGRGEWGTRHPSIVGCSVVFPVLLCCLFCCVPCFVGRPISFFSSLAISSIRVAYSITDRTPPCLMLSLIFISLVSPCLVWILALRFEFSFFYHCQIFFLWLRSYAVHVIFRPAMLCRRLFERPGISCMLLSYHFWFLRWFGLGL